MYVLEEYGLPKNIKIIFFLFITCRQEDREP